MEWTPCILWQLFAKPKKRRRDNCLMLALNPKSFTRMTGVKYCQWEGKANRESVPQVDVNNITSRQEINEQDLLFLQSSSNFSWKEGPTFGLGNSELHWTQAEVSCLWKQLYLDYEGKYTPQSSTKVRKKKDPDSCESYCSIQTHKMRKKSAEST